MSAEWLSHIFPLHPVAGISFSARKQRPWCRIDSLHCSVPDIAAAQLGYCNNGIKQVKYKC